MSSNEKAKIVDRGSLSNVPESTGFKVFLDRVIHFGENLGGQVNGRSQKS